MTKYLGIDYGLAHIGLATSEHTLATPLPSLPHDSHLFSQLSALIREQGITSIVCGIPEGILAPKVTLFARNLEHQTGIKVILHQETLSSYEAKQKLHEIGASLFKKKNDHAYAACLILEDYLELTQSSRA